MKNYGALPEHRCVALYWASQTRSITQSCARLSRELGNIWLQPRVLPRMESNGQRVGGPEWLILIGASFFIIVLTMSAIWEADIRWLHFFQALMYVVTIALSLRRKRWGYFIGISAAGLWDYANIVATTFFFNGLQQLSEWIRTGHLAHPDLLIAVPAWFSNFFVIVGCAWAYSRLAAKTAADIARFLVAF